MSGFPTIPVLCAEMAQVARDRLGLGDDIEVKVIIELRCVTVDAPPQGERPGLTDSDWTYLESALENNKKALGVVQALRRANNAFTPGQLLRIEEKSAADSISTTIRRATKSVFSLRMSHEDRRSGKSYGDKKFRLVKTTAVA